MPTATYGPTAPPPTLGYGQRSEAPIDTVNQWMRAQPWYQSLLKSFGQDPNNVHLNDSQKQQVIRAAQANGVVVDEGHDGQEVDNSGNFQAKSHTLRNIGIAAGIVGAVLATAGLAGAFAPAAVGGVEAGASAGLGTAALPGAMATLPALSSVAVPAAAAATAAGAGAAGAGAGAGAAFDAAGNFIGPSTVSSVAGPAAATYGPAAATGLGASDALKYGLPVAGGLVNSLIQANASGKATDAQQAYLQQALDYEKQQDALNRQIAADKVKLEAGRYATYAGNISPYLATGNAAAGRAASLLGVTPPAPMNAPPAPPPTTTGSIAAATGATPAPGVTTQPQARTADQPAAMVSLRAPDGSVQQRPASELQHWLSKGATQVAA